MCWLHSTCIVAGIPEYLADKGAMALNYGGVDSDLPAFLVTTENAFNIIIKLGSCPSCADMVLDMSDNSNVFNSFLRKCF